MINIQPSRIDEKQSFLIHDIALFKQKALSWANEYETCCFLDNNGDKINNYHSYGGLLAVGIKDELIIKEQQPFEALKSWYAKHPRWVFGYLGYDLKNSIENHLFSNNNDFLTFQDIHFFEPQFLIEFHTQSITVHAPNPFSIFLEILRSEPDSFPSSLTDINLKNRIKKVDYLKTIQTIKEHIIEGDIYELNFCQEFYAKDVTCSPIHLFNRLNQNAKTPFAAYYKNKHQHAACASPERFIKKEGETLISQPIKGTAKRSKNLIQDQILRTELYESEKNRAENVMIVDLVRNDFARSCEAGSVKVEELFKVYSFEHVHQMISTVVGTLRKEVHPIDAIKNAFPMGSMTGAPKIMSMQLIEKLEQSKRGLYSGAIGYITPNQDFDFNVVIRSILYNTATKNLAFQVGGAIVYDSDPEEEYQECLTKAKAMLEVFELK